MDSQGVFCPNLACPARGQADHGNIRVHSRHDRRYRCQVCGKTFAATVGTPLYRCHRPVEVVVQVVTLLAFGCPPRAIQAAFGLDRRTVAAWARQAGTHCERAQQALVEQPQALGQVQADELRVKRQGGVVWVAMALAVTSRLWLGAVVRVERDGVLAERLAGLVRRAAVRAALLWSVDGWAPYVRAVQRVFRDPVRTGRRGRPRLVPWPDLALAQVIKRRAHHHLVAIERRLRLGQEEVAAAVRTATQASTVCNTAWIERLNATFRARLPALVRRGRSLARQVTTLHHAVYLTGTVYNFCTPHATLSRREHRTCTPAMAAGLTNHCWAMQELLTYQVPPPRWQPRTHRGRRSRTERTLIARWCA